ncbi:hypothetical protein IC3_03511 [Bacillus cereus VD142]|nr:hypothetical protein IC3_03511 [Bacillus cereus VD142]
MEHVRTMGIKWQKRKGIDNLKGNKEKGLLF